MERASSAAISKPKFLPVVLLSTIPLKLLRAGSSSSGNCGIEERNGKVNTRHNRKRPYERDEADNERSLSIERTSCSNCNKQTNNQSSVVSSTSSGGGGDCRKKQAAISSMIQSPMLILPIVTSATNKSSTQVNVFCSQQQQKQQQLHHPAVYFAAKKAADESNGCNGGNATSLCGVREISCSFKHTNYNFLPRRRRRLLLL